METLRRLKPYKTTSPMETIHRIRQILFENQLFVIETSQKRDPTTGVCSCRIILGDEELRNLSIGSNGKGMNAVYALASAYAELMERLQCGAILWKTTGIPSSVPGAFFVEQKELKQMAKSLLLLSFGDAADVTPLAEQFAASAQSGMAITFQSYTTGEELSFPVELYNRMTGSNGMASGNTLLEATLQGLSEIFERAALAHIFLSPITPPIIDKALFEGCDVLDRLERLQSKGISYSILDCSIGKGLPVIGLLLEKNGEFHMQFGSDPSPITALERCLTETFQGKELETIPFYPLLPEGTGGRARFDNAKREFQKGRGRVPMWVVRGTPSWSFTGFEHPVSRSNEEDMEYYLYILEQWGKQLYVMDCSFLGFPAVRLYVPGMCEMHCPEPEYCASRRMPETVKAMLCRLPLLTDSETHQLALQMREWLENTFQIHSPDDFYSGDLLEAPKLFPAGEFPVKSWDNRLLVAAVYLRGGLTQEGDAYLRKAIDERKYPDSVVQLLNIRFHNRALTFPPSQWPQCPDCQTCRARHLCRKNAVDALRSRLTKKLGAPYANGDHPDWEPQTVTCK